MKHEDTDEELQTRAALYALGALSQHEAAAFEAHLREGCTACEVELRGFEAVATAMAASATEATPEPYLRDLLTARLQREVEAPPERVASIADFAERVGRTETTIGKPLGWGAILPWAIAATFLVAFVVSFVSLRGERNELQAQLDATLQDESSAVKDNLELRDRLKRESGLAEELAQVNSVLASERKRVIALAGQEPATNSSGRVYWDLKTGKWVVTADLPPPPPGKVYQLWFVTRDAKISAGLIKADSTGHGFAVVGLPANITSVAAAAITLEPEGGSVQPTMPIYLLGEA